MKAFLRVRLGVGPILAVLILAMPLTAILAPMAAQAGGVGGSKGCGCTTPPPPPCNCNVPTGHNVTIPGVNISPPAVVVNSPSIFVSAPSVEVQAASVAFAQSSASSQASSSSAADAQSQANGQAAVYSNALAAVNAASVATGAASGYAVSEGSNSYIPNLQVEAVGTAEARRVCAEFRATPKVVALQAVCLDDKAVPHPASQVMPDRDVAPGYEGEVFRCIAGTRMQYTLAEYAGSADFARGQTVSCVKGDALYHAAGGQLACRPQRPARDCNERSLLRRYGAGFKLLKLAVGQQCVAYRTETAQSAAPGSLLLDGGVGGVVH